MGLLVGLSSTFANVATTIIITCMLLNEIFSSGGHYHTLEVVEIEAKNQTPCQTTPDTFCNLAFKTIIKKLV